MRNIINPSYFTPALQFNEHNQERIRKICSPLKDCFGIDYFGYFRFLNDGRYIFLSNCSVWQEAFFYDYVMNTEHFIAVPNSLSKYETLKHVWPDNIKDETIEFLKNKKIYNGFNIAMELEGSLDSCFFGTNCYSKSVEEFYRTHFFVFEDFIRYFKKIAKDLIDAADTSRQGISPFLQATFPQIETIFKKTTPLEENIIKFNTLLQSHIAGEIHEIGKRNLLSPREIQCLSHASTGMTAKEIAKSLGIGYRTVETHLDKVRLKTQCYTKKELLHWFEDKFNHLL